VLSALAAPLPLDQRRIDLIEAVVFDFDGTVFDSESHEYEVIAEIFGEHGATLPLEVWGACVGREAGFFDPVAYLEEQTGLKVDRESLATLKRKRFHERIVACGAIPGVVETLAAARALGLKLGLASSSDGRWIHGQLDRLELRGWFDCIRTADDVSRVKPDSELYLSVLEGLGVSPQRAVAVEDSPNGALAARRAGMYCVVVPNSITARLQFGEHDLRLDSLQGVELRELLRRLAPEA
jgi:HAD superfamily hydrolase (TIGR01509 family)